MTDVSKTNAEVIDKNRKLWLDTRGVPVITTTKNGEANAIRWGWTEAKAVAADALATRVPVQGEPNDDREALKKIIDRVDDGDWGNIFPEERDEIADAILAAGFSRATVPDAATQAKQPEGWSNEDAQAAADQAFARWSTHDERDVWNRNGFRLGAEWQKARETFISYKSIADEARAERDAALAALDRARAAVKLCSPDDMTPPATRIILAALDGAPEPEWDQRMTSIKQGAVRGIAAHPSVERRSDDY